MADRRDRALRDLDVGGGRGLEIGPLFQPIALKSDTNVSYVDVQSREQLVEYYSTHPGIPVEQIVDVDFSLSDDSGMRTLAVATGGQVFDWVIASHVIEHVPDMIGWLAEVAEVLVDDGRLSLMIPDRRLTFDARRTPTTVGQLIQANRAGDPHPSVRAIFDHFYEASSVSAEAKWQGAETGPDSRMHTFDYVEQMLEKSKAPDVHIDCHVWVFSPVEFFEQLRTLAELELLDFSIHSTLPTTPFEDEFYVTLARVPRGLDAATKRVLIDASVDGAVAAAAEAEPIPVELSPAMVLSDKELRLIEAKRVVMRKAYRAVDRARRLTER